ncbi:hypothetical protein SERLA73DRAFT_181930, partial [Serpula lacrymans var. lacrymans S7.3]
MATLPYRLRSMASHTLFSFQNIYEVLDSQSTRIYNSTNRPSPESIWVFAC